MKVYITQYALTDGIYTAEVEHSIYDTMVVEKNKGPLRTYHKPNWHTTKEEAIKRAEKMREDKIRSLKKSLDRMEKLKFDV